MRRIEVRPRSVRIDALFADYGASHSTRGNLLCHAAGITLIVFGLFSFLARIPIAGIWTASELLLALTFAFYAALDSRSLSRSWATPRSSISRLGPPRAGSWARPRSCWDGFSRAWGTPCTRRPAPPFSATSCTFSSGRRISSRRSWASAPASAEGRHDRVGMVEPVALPRRIGVELEDRAAELLERVLVHDDGDPGRFEAMPFVGSVLLDRDAEARPPASEDVPDGKDRVREVGLGAQPSAASGVMVRGGPASSRGFVSEATGGMPRKRLPVAVSIATSDSGGGAGIQADLLTFAAHGVYGATVLAAGTAQNTRAVTGIETFSAGFLTRQIDAVFSDLRPDAVKIGMLFDATRIRTVARGLKRHRAKNVVLDPVMVAKTGAASSRAPRR